MYTYNKQDAIREFELAQRECKSYFDYMYKVLQFSFAAIIAIIAAASQLFDADSPNIENIKAIILSYILPISTYIFGVMYAYNAYALTVCGKQAEKLHNEIYTFETDEMDISDNLVNKNVKDFPRIKKYIVTDRKITFFAYGLQLMFYVAFPVSSDVFSLILCDATGSFFFYKILPFIMTFLYLIIMSIIIFGIGKDFLIESKDKLLIKNLIRKKDKRK